MGRETKRVPLDFDWPQDKIWSGYVMPDSLGETDCDACGGRGATTARLWVKQIAMLALLVDDDLNAQARGRSLHPYLQGSGTVAHGTRPSADIADFGTGLCGRAGSGWGHDAIDRWNATEKLIQAAGLDSNTWGKCSACAGYGSNEVYPGQRADAEAWEPSQPPTGVGWQMWETTSEGSPMSPVFASAQELAAWLADTHASLFGSTTAATERWLSIITGDQVAAVQVAPGVIMM